MNSALLEALIISSGFKSENLEEATKWLTVFSTSKEAIMCVLVSFLQIEKTFSFPQIKALRVAIVLFNTGYPNYTFFPNKFSSQPWSECEKTALVEFLMGELTPEEFQRLIPLGCYTF